MFEEKPFTTPFDDSTYFKDPSLYRSFIRALQYLTLFRPDFAFLVNKLSQFLQKSISLH